MTEAFSSNLYGIIVLVAVVAFIVFLMKGKREKDALHPRSDLLTILFALSKVARPELSDGTPKKELFGIRTPYFVINFGSVSFVCPHDDQGNILEMEVQISGSNYARFTPSPLQVITNVDSDYKRSAVSLAALGLIARHEKKTYKQEKTLTA